MFRSISYSCAKANTFVTHVLKPQLTSLHHNELLLIIILLLQIFTMFVLMKGYFSNWPKCRDNFSVEIGTVSNAANNWCFMFSPTYSQKDILPIALSMRVYLSSALRKNRCFSLSCYMRRRGLTHFHVSIVRGSFCKHTPHICVIWYNIYDPVFWI